MKRLFTGLFLSLALTASQAQSFNPQLAAMLQDTLNKYNALITNIKGMSASVYIPGQGSWQGCAGVSYAGQPITRDMEFGIASNTKLFVATTMLILQENNLLDLDDSLSEWLPTYPNINPNITIRQLLNHTSGVADPYFVSPWMDTIMNNPDRVFTPNEVLGWVGPPVFNPGTSWGYSNTNYVLAGMIAEVATGYHISQLIRDSILIPLNLDSTFYDVEEPILGTVAHRWYNTVDYHDTSRVGLNTACGAAGAIFSTASDMTKWYPALMTGQLLDSTSLAELTNFVVTGGPYTYGLGIENNTFFGRTLWGHGGSTWGYRSKTFYDPCLGVAVFGIANSYPAGSDGVTLLLYKTVIDHLPLCAEPISGPTTVCQGENSLTYTVPPVANATSYIWTLPAGVTGISNTNSITVDFDLTAVPSEISVRGTNSFGDGSTASIFIDVIQKPTTPIISQNINTLQSNAPSGNQWYDSNGMIIGANDQTYDATSDGEYYVVATVSGCSSDTSNHINLVMTGMPSNERELSFLVYPNPAYDEVIVEASSSSNATFFELENPIGTILRSGSFDHRLQLNTSAMSSGIYLIKLTSDQKTSIQMLMIK
jgi:D-alanyl-D-alanine carboxypeptidase